MTGIRPLVKDPHSKNTESLVRSHLVTVSPSGLLTCAGGKWTTYRQMAEDAVDKAIEVFKLTPGHAIPRIDISGMGGHNDSEMLDGKCKTHQIRLIGAHAYSKTLFINLIQQYGIEADVAKHLAQSYGDRAWEVAEMSAPADNSQTTHYPLRGRRLSPLFPFVDGEVRYAVRREYAQTAVDIIARRTRLSFLNATAALEALPAIVDLMAEELGWNPARSSREWADTVRFLTSMGLPAAQATITRDQVLRGEHLLVGAPAAATEAEAAGPAAAVAAAEENESRARPLPLPPTTAGQSQIRPADVADRPARPLAH